MKCKNCGTEIFEESMYCSRCGHKVNDLAEYKGAFRESDNNMCADYTTQTILDWWKQQDLFCKACVVVIVFAILSFIIALLANKFGTRFWASLQLIGSSVALLMHKGKIECKKEWKKYVVLIIAFLLAGTIIKSFIPSKTNNNKVAVEESTLIKVPFSASECLNMGQEDLEREFLLAGYRNIIKKQLCDLGIDESEKNGLVESVVIEGKKDFLKGTEYENSTKIIITYHSFKEIEIPLSSKDVVHMDVEELMNLLSKAGFFNVEVDEKFDLDPDETDLLFENTILINGIENFPKDKTFPLDANIQIVSHKPYEKYTLKILIDFIPNLLFNKYDVQMDIADYSERIAHGEDKVYEYRLKKGTYYLTFASEENGLDDEFFGLELSGNTEVSFKLSCDSDSVNVEKVYIENKGAIGEGEAMVPKSADDCKFDNYIDIEKQFKDAGFTNLTTKVLYDIVLSWTEEGEVESVSVDGRTDYEKGEIFNMDVPIVITYHMKEEDDPSRITMPENSTNYVGVDYKAVEETFKKLGFTNVVVESNTTSDTSYVDGAVYSVKADYESFEKGNTYAPDDKITIKYYIVEEVEENNWGVESTVTENITIENHSEFAGLMKITDQTDAATIKAFVNAHIGDIVEFDGCVALMMKHEGYKTRFDVCMAGVDYDADRVYGPLFVFENVAFHNMNVSGTDTVAEGMNFRITGEIKGYSSAGGYILLKPVSMKAR